MRATCPAPEDLPVTGVIDINEGVERQVQAGRPQYVSMLWSDTPRSAGPAHQTVDMDLVAFLFDENSNAVDVVFFGHPRSQVGQDDPGAIWLESGDQKHGYVGESINLNLRLLPARISHVAIVGLSTNLSIPISLVDDIVIFVHENTTQRPASSSPPSDRLRFKPYIALPPAADPRHMALFVSFRRGTGRNADSWSLRSHADALRGSTFAEVVPSLSKGLRLPSQEGQVLFRFPVFLEKNECVALGNAATAPPGNYDESQDGHGYRKNNVLSVGLGWDIADMSDEACDVDLSCIALDSNAAIVDLLYWSKLSACEGALRHSGDNTTGEGDGEDETIFVDLDRMPATVSSLVFAVSNYTSGSLSGMNNVFFSLKNASNEGELIRFDGIGLGGEYTSFLPCMLERVPYTSADLQTRSFWAVRVLSLPCPGKTVTDASLRTALIKAAVALSSRGGDVQKTGPADFKPVNLKEAMLRGGEAKKWREERKEQNRRSVAAQQAPYGSQEPRRVDGSPALDLPRVTQSQKALQFMILIVVCAIAFVAPVFLYGARTSSNESY